MLAFFVGPGFTEARSNLPAPEDSSDRARSFGLEFPRGRGADDMSHEPRFHDWDKYYFAAFLGALVAFVLFGVV